MLKSIKEILFLNTNFVDFMQIFELPKISVELVSRRLTVLSDSFKKSRIILT